MTIPYFVIFLKETHEIKKNIVPIAVADLRGARETPPGPNSFNFMQFLGKFGKFVCWRPPGELAPPPRGNPGSATVLGVVGGYGAPLRPQKDRVIITAQ